METEISLFISSTSDLQEERKALLEDKSLNRLYRLFLYEDFGAGSDEEDNVYPEAILRERLEKSDVFICLLGPRFGSFYKPPEDLRSIVEWEFSTAQFRRVELMAFRKHVPDDLIEPPQRDFINRVTMLGKGGRWCAKFDSPQTLKQLVRECLEKWLGRQYKKAQARAIRWFDRLIAPFAFGLTVACVLVTLLFITQILPFSQSSVFGFCGLTFFTILLIILARKS